MSPYGIVRDNLPPGWREDSTMRLVEAIEAYGRERLEEVLNLADDHCCDGYYCNCRRNIKAAIRALIDQPKENQ